MIFFFLWGRNVFINTNLLNSQTYLQCYTRWLRFFPLIIDDIHLNIISCIQQGTRKNFTSYLQTTWLSKKKEVENIGYSILLPFFTLNKSLHVEYKNKIILTDQNKIFFFLLNISQGFFQLCPTWSPEVALWPTNVSVLIL